MSGGLAGTVAPSSAQGLVRSRRSKTSEMSRVSMVPMLSRVSVMSGWYLAAAMVLVVVAGAVVSRRDGQQLL